MFQFLKKSTESQKLNVVILLTILCLQHVIEAQNNRSRDQDYGIIIDAGSSGSRVRVYSWNEGMWFPGHAGDLPEITEVDNQKVEPGISSFAGNLTGLDRYMTRLIEEAKRIVPEQKQSMTRIYVLATAGMRLLMEDDANNVIFAINDLLEDPSVNPFDYVPLNTRILSGEEEGVFAWITVNYLRDFFTFHNGVEDFGIFELGGASAQIAFQHKGSILADKFPVTISSRIYPIYVHSYLGFGQEQIFEKTHELAIERQPLQDGQRRHPCMVKDDVLVTTTEDMEVVEFVGTGDADACLQYMDEIVYTSPNEDWCLPKPCAIGTVYQPRLDTEMQFYALSAFVFPLQVLDIIPGGVLAQDGSYSPADALAAARIYCATPVAELEEKLERYNLKDCVNALYSSVLLEKGFGFSPSSRNIRAVREIFGEPIEWPLGALIYETERYLEECEPIIIISPSAAPSVCSNVNQLWITVIFVLLFASLKHI